MENDNNLDRINKEWKLCKKSVTLGTIGASAGPVNKNNLFYWEAIISGPNQMILHMKEEYLPYQ